MYENHIESEENQDTKCRDSALCIAKSLYFTHLFASAIFATVLLIVEPHLRSRFTLTLALVIIYGFMLPWLLLFNLFSVVVLY